MVELRSEPYTLKTRPDVIETEQEFRDNLNLAEVNGTLFNVLAFKNSAVLAEYDAMLWREDKVWFIEYKDSHAANKRMSAKRVQQVSDMSRNLARIFGFAKYNFTIVVKGIKKSVIKGNANVVPLEDLFDFQPEYASTYLELDYIDKLISKYTRSENPAELNRDKIVTELNNIKTMVMQRI
ncbi:MAG: hypothetical protein ACT6FE_01320 [Methanosarcinaceae archaeon]